jgi:hypothetical protein
MVRYCKVVVCVYRVKLVLDFRLQRDYIRGNAPLIDIYIKVSERK